MPVYTPAITVKSLEHHRNGITGAPFWAALVEWDGRPFVAIFDWPDSTEPDPKLRRRKQEETVRALNIPMLLDPNVGVGGDNHWKGADYLGSILVEAFHEREVNSRYSPNCPFDEPECAERVKANRIALWGADEA